MESDEPSSVERFRVQGVRSRDPGHSSADEEHKDFRFGLRPLAVEDVFCQRSVPEVQELLRQLQLQQANDAEEVRNLIGIRYLSFLEGLPEISRMQRTAEEALQEAKDFGSCLKRLGVAVTGETSASSDNVDRPREHQHKQLLQELLLQRSTPLDDFLFARIPDSSTGALAPSFDGKASSNDDACLGFLFDAPGPSGQLEQSRPQSCRLRFLQQQLLLLPCRVWEALRRHRFLEGLRLVLVEGSHQAAAATSAVHELQQQQQLMTGDLTHAAQTLQHRERQYEGCLALAQQTTSATPSLVSSVRSLALRYLASADLSLPLAADAAAAATLIFLLEGLQYQSDGSEQAQDELVAAAAKWLMTVFFSARGEALDFQGALVGSALRAAVRGDVESSTAGARGAAAVDAAEGLLVAFTSSADAAAFLFWPSCADTAAGQALTPTTPVGGRASSAAPPPSAFAAVRAAEAALGTLAAPAPAALARALQALRKVFCRFEAQLRSSTSCGGSEAPGGGGCCNNKDLCPRAKLAAFTEQWNAPLEARLCRLPHEGPWRRLSDIRSFWLALRERLQLRSQQWRLCLDSSLFAVGRLNANLKPGKPEPSCGGPDREHLLRVLGEACVEACTAMCDARARELPLFAEWKGDGEPVDSPAGYEGREKHGRSAFEKDMDSLLTDLADLVGALDKTESSRASMPVRATIAAAFLRALGESANSLKSFACAVGSVGARASHGGAPLGCDQETCAALMWKARRVEWLFVACSPRVASEARTSVCGSQRSKPAPGDPEQTEDLEEPLDCQRKLGEFFVQWTAGIAERKDLEEAFVEGEDRRSGGQFQRRSSEREIQADPAGAANAAARSFLSDVCISSLLGYAVGSWPFVEKSIKELQASWRWRSTTLNGASQERGAMSLLLEVCRYLTATLHDLNGKLEAVGYLSFPRRVENLNAAPLLCYALKSVTAEAAASAASAAIAGTADKHQQTKGNVAAHLSQNSLLQLVVDIESLAEALSGMPPTLHFQKLPDDARVLSMSVRKAVEGGLNNRCSAEALREVAREGRQHLSPHNKEALTRCVAGGLSFASSLFLVLGDSKGSHAGMTHPPSADGLLKRSTAPPGLAAPRQRLPLLPIKPLPAFASVIRPLPPELHEASGSQEATNDGTLQDANQQQPKERLKQLPRLRLDDGTLRDHSFHNALHIDFSEESKHPVDDSSVREILPPAHQPLAVKALRTESCIRRNRPTRAGCCTFQLLRLVTRCGRMRTEEAGVSRFANTLAGLALQLRSAHCRPARSTAGTVPCRSCETCFSSAGAGATGAYDSTPLQDVGGGAEVLRAASTVPATSTRGSGPSTTVTAAPSPSECWGFSPIPFIARGRSMPGQRLLPCTQEDVEILAAAQTKYPSPQEVDSGIVVRIIAAKDVHKVTSPILRVVRNRQYGIRKGERLRLALFGAFFSAVLCALGAWQLRRMEEKKKLIEYRRNHLAMQPTLVLSSPFPWTLEAAGSSEQRKYQAAGASGAASDASGSFVPSICGEGVREGSSPCAEETSPLKKDPLVPDAKRSSDIERAGASSERRRQRSGFMLAQCSAADVDGAVATWAYRPVVVRGILDSSTELFVGPRPGLEVGTPGYCVVSPLRLEDGSVILVNKGHLSVKLAKLPPFHKAVDEEDYAGALVQQQRMQPSRRQSGAFQQPGAQLDHMQQQEPRVQYVDIGSRQRLEQLQELAGSRTEPVARVTVRGILEPGETANSSFKSLMLQNRPQDGQFLVLNPKDLADATPGISNRAEAGLLMVNAYSIVYDEDVLSSTDRTEGDVRKVANRFLGYQQRQKADYLLFYADEHTHFNYACQWFLMGLCTAAMTIYKVIEVTRWRW
ncbi:hypothetical protein ACSSS7_002407 [Eimeria intestinalis]